MDTVTIYLLLTAQRLSEDLAIVSISMTSETSNTISFLPRYLKVYGWQ